MYILLKVFTEAVQNCVSINNEIIPNFQDVVEIIMNFWIYTSIKTNSQKKWSFGKDQTFIWQYTEQKCLELPEMHVKGLLWTACFAFEKHKRQRVFLKKSPCVSQPLENTEKRL